MRKPASVVSLRGAFWWDHWDVQLYLKLDSILQQPTWRLWGEERLDGVVYTVYLKKVRYHSPSRSITTVGHPALFIFFSSTF